MKYTKVYLLLFVVLFVGFVNFSSADFLSDSLSSVVGRLEYIGETIGTFFESVKSFIYYIFTGVQTLRFGFITILTSIYNIIVEFFNSGFFS